MDILVDVNDKKSDPVGAILLLMTGHALIGTRPCCGAQFTDRVASEAPPADRGTT